MTKKSITYQELERIKQYGRLCWDNLSDDEKELWFLPGTPEFVEHIIDMLRLSDAEMTDEQFEILIEYICWID